MKITRRSFAGEVDWQQMMALVQMAPHENLHVMDLPYRFSSWAFDAPDNTSLWEDSSGRLLAWSTLQTPFWSIDYALHPDAPAALLGDALRWADEQAQRVLDTPYGRPIWFVNVFEEQRRQRQELETIGFADQAEVGEDSWSKVLLMHTRQLPDSGLPLPAGFAIRPLAGETEVPAYVALHRAVFQSESMTQAWRQRTLRRSEYNPALDLVVTAPDGQLAGFCVCWFSQHGPGSRPSGQIEPLGVAEAFRHRGLGHALLSEAVQRLYQHGAEQVFVETDLFRDAALALYEAVGFTVHRRVQVYRKDYGRLG